MKFHGLGHINIVVDNIKDASDFYEKIFGGIPHQEFNKFKNIGFAKSAGFMDNPEDVCVTIRFIEIPGTPIFIELMEYHSPKGNATSVIKKTNDFGGVGHICLRVENIDEAFEFIRNQKGIRLISENEHYRPFRIDNIKPSEFYFIDSEKENDKVSKDEVCKIVGNIRYFYFIDKYGIQWEFEQGHSDIGG